MVKFFHLIESFKTVHANYMPQKILILQKPYFFYYFMILFHQIVVVHTHDWIFVDII